MSKIVITKMIPPNATKEAVISGLIENDKLVEVHLEDLLNKSKLNNIYIGKVQNIVKNINAAFIEFEHDCVGYYSLEELPGAIFTTKKGKKPLVIGDELLVQVVKEAHKTKAAMLTTNLNFMGKYFVFITGNKGLGLSSKLSGKVKKELRELVKTNYNNEKYGIIVRTNAQDAEKEKLVEELKSMEAAIDSLIENAKYRTVFSKINQTSDEYITLIKNAYQSQIDEIITDDTALYENIKEYLEQYQPQDMNKLRFYKDNMLPLKKLYSLEFQLEAASKAHVWLKSGAYLVIEQTEAFTVIDVNTGKFDGNKKKKDTFLKINLEAAKEAAKQIRLRNVSGIILVDFINMTCQEDNRQLMQQFSEFVKADRVKTTVVDMTALGIVEVTRKKEHCCLAEALKQLR